MISAKFLWGNVFFGGKLQIDANNSNFEIFESVLYHALFEISEYAFKLKPIRNLTDADAKRTAK